MAVRYEWQTAANGRRRYVRIQDDTPETPKLPSKRTRPVPPLVNDAKAANGDAAVVTAEAPKPRRGRPPKAKPVEVPAPVVIEDESDDE
jgi:hypothetical protein